MGKQEALGLIWHEFELHMVSVLGEAQEEAANFSAGQKGNG